MSDKKLLLSYLKQEKKSLIISFVLFLFSSVSNIIVPIYIGKCIDNFNQEFFYKYLIIMIGFILTYFIFDYFGNYILKKSMIKMSNDLKVNYAYTLNKCKISELDKYTAGDIVSRFINDVDSLTDGISKFLIDGIISVITIIILFIIMFRLNAKLGFVILLLTPIIVIFPLIITKKTKKNYVKMVSVEGDIRTFTSDVINNFNYIKGAIIEENVDDKFLNVIKKYKKINQKSIFSSSLANPTSRFLNGLMLVLVVFIGGSDTIKGVITIGTFQVFINYMGKYIKPFNELASLSGEVNNALSSLTRINEILSLNKEKSGDLVIRDTLGNIDICDINFTYKKDIEMYHNLNIKIEQNKKYAFVGVTGSGKTTIINLIMKFYDYNSGIIKLDGLDINNLNLESYRDLFGVVLQDNYLIDGTVFDNLMYGNNKSYDEVLEVCKRIKCHDFIMKLKNNYNTDVRKINLSSGEKSLISIARVMLKNPRILILDEATSDIDTLTEENVVNALNLLMENRTTLIIAHRLSTIEACDKIFVFDSFNLKEEGTHQELLERRGIYFNIYRNLYEE